MSWSGGWESQSPWRTLHGPQPDPYPHPAVLEPVWRPHVIRCSRSRCSSKYFPPAYSICSPLPGVTVLIGASDFLLRLEFPPLQTLNRIVGIFLGHVCLANGWWQWAQPQGEVDISNSDSERAELYKVGFGNSPLEAALVWVLKRSRTNRRTI